MVEQALGTMTSRRDRLWRLSQQLRARIQRLDYEIETISDSALVGRVVVVRSNGRGRRHRLHGQRVEIIRPHRCTASVLVANRLERVNWENLVVPDDDQTADAAPEA